MLALLAAATLAATTTAPPEPGVHVFRGAPTAGVIMPAHVRARSCGLWRAQPVKRDAPSAGPQVLAKLPPANHELAVLRLDKDGCSLPVVVRENVSGDGRFATPRD